jgi:hypothetical protein
MAYFAKLDNTNTVVNVISVSNEACGEPTLTFPDTCAAGRAFIANTLKLDGIWKQTSFNSSFRGTYAGIGYTYDAERDSFIPPKPFDSWLLDEDTYRWEAPVTYPTDGLTYIWNEENIDWELINLLEPEA